MARRRRMPEQVINKLREAQGGLDAGAIGGAGL